MTVIKFDPDTTIVAPASGTGGAISVVRMSGKHAHSVISRIFKPHDTDKEADAKSNGFSIVYGDIMDKGKILDDVLVSYFRKPNSYTGEDSIEISCHASSYIQQRIMELLIDNGASPARPGEFTQRAFMNGKMDLSQAEAVADLISSASEASHRLAIKQMRGGYSDEINKIRERMLHFASMIELELDFSEEDVEFANRNELRDMVLEIKSYTDTLASSFKYGNAIKNGVPVAIVGKPNVGKSTLLNALLKDDRAIVSEIPGTTRDVIEDTVNIEGVLFRFIDTAGLRETADVIENLGIRKTYQKIDHADIVILLADASDSTNDINSSYSEILNQVDDKNKTIILVINKCDLLSEEKKLILLKQLKCPGNKCLMISAVKGKGISELTNIILRSIKDNSDENTLIVTNLRHYNSLRSCSESLARVIQNLDDRIPEDLIAMDLRQAIHYLGEITGEISTDEILGNIFKNFCIGK